MSLKVKIFFKTATIACGKEEAQQLLEVGQLMPSGALLAAIADNGSMPSSDGDQKNIKLIAGPLVKLCTDGLSLLSIQPGYPTLVREDDEMTLRITISLEPLFLISEDAWTAKMSLYPSAAPDTLPECSTILEMLKSEGVCWGIREKNIATALATMEANNLPQKNHIVARGRLPVNGENARLRLAFSTAPQSGKVQGDGRIDYRERRLFIGVDQGQLLATKVKATPGIPGVDIFGREVSQVPGKDIFFKPGPDILCDLDTGEIRAAFAGVLSVINENNVKVSAKHVISGDIDFHTGNIDSRDAVDISGTVKPGFKVTTGGDVVIGGNVEAASVDSRANVVLRGGILGEKALVQAAGDVDLNFSEGGSVFSRGSTIIRREVYFSTIQSLGDIICPKEARVVASDLYAGGSISVFQVDTDSSPNSLLAAATDPPRYERYLQLLKNLHLAQARIEKWHRHFGPGARNEGLEELEQELSDARSELLPFNLVPVSSEHDKTGGLRYACKQKISIGGWIQAGALIRIGNAETTLQNNYGKGYFALNSDTDKIEFHATAT